jgi:hypothetical protein
MTRNGAGSPPDEEDFLGEDAADVDAHFCQDGHLHIVLTDGDGDDIAGIVLGLEDGIHLVESLLLQIQEMTGMTFVLTELPEDPVGETVGNA